MSMTTFYTAASTATELADALLLTASPSSTSNVTSSNSSSVDEDMMMLDFDVDDSPLPTSPVSCLAYLAADRPVWSGHRRHGSSITHQPSSLDLITGDPDAMSSAVFCFVKSFVCASGSSTVAIDNKIEQAMDLVKSHLMFAVREEVEVLKERIAYLEAENAILRAAASPETLAQIAQLESTFLAGGGSGGNVVEGGNSAGVVGVGGGISGGMLLSAASLVLPTTTDTSVSGPTGAAVTTTTTTMTTTSANWPSPAP